MLGNDYVFQQTSPILPKHTCFRLELTEQKMALRVTSEGDGVKILKF